MQLIDDIVNNFWLFQTESVVPLFQELSIWILILFAGKLIFTIGGAVVLNKNQHKVPIGLVLYPIFVALSYFILVMVGGYFNFDFNSIDLPTIDNAIKYWWVFLIFWPVVILKIPFQLFGKKGEGGGNSLVSFVFAPIYEELAFRYLAINTIFLLTNSIEIALFFQAIAFSLIHLPNKDQNGWAGPVSLNFSFIGGLIYGIIAIQYGLIFAVITHAAHNIINRLVGDYL